MLTNDSNVPINHVPHPWLLHINNSIFVYFRHCDKTLKVEYKTSMSYISSEYAYNKIICSMADPLIRDIVWFRTTIQIKLIRNKTRNIDIKHDTYMYKGYLEAYIFYIYSLVHISQCIHTCIQVFVLYIGTSGSDYTSRRESWKLFQSLPSPPPPPYTHIRTHYCCCHIYI